MGWIDISCLYKLNDLIRRERVIVIKDYVVVFGVADKWIEVMDLKEKVIVFRVIFEGLGGIDLGISEVCIKPDFVAWDIFNEWVGGGFSI